MSEPFEPISQPWKREWIVAEDSDLLVVNKPAGISTAASESHRDDDVVRRVKSFLSARDGLAYIAIPAPLERDVSGVLVLSKQKSANASLAKQFERSTVTRVYLVALENWPKRLGTEGLLSRGDRKTKFRVLDQRGARALIELGPVLGSLVSLRKQLADAWGQEHRDSLENALFHAHSVTLQHPRDERAVSFEAPAPLNIRAWTSPRVEHPVDDTEVVRDSLQQASIARFGLAREMNGNAFRLANDSGDGLPGVTVDRYGEHALVQFYFEPTEAQRERVLDAVEQHGPRGIYVKFRPRQANNLVDTRRDSLAPSLPVRGTAAPTEFPIRELGLEFLVRLGDGLSTGIFLDQRENRRRVRELARDARVLNLFAYTCPFTVAAVAGNARTTVSVDVSSAALAWGQRNLEINHFSAKNNAFVTADVFGWLEGARARGDQFDLVILDPPSYSTTKSGSRFSAESDYRDLASLAMSVVAPGGKLLACSNHRGILRIKLRRYLFEAARAVHREAKQMRDLPDPMDFPAKNGSESHLKSILVSL